MVKPRLKIEPRLIGKKGRLVIPFDIRYQLDINDGDIVYITLDEKNHIIISTKEPSLDIKQN